jgi:hypothetical protein
MSRVCGRNALVTDLCHLSGTTYGREALTGISVLTYNDLRAALEAEDAVPAFCEEAKQADLAEQDQLGRQSFDMTIDNIQKSSPPQK